MATDANYLAAIRNLDSDALGKKLYGTAVRFSCVDYDGGTTKAFLCAGSNGCTWATTDDDSCLFTIESSNSETGSFFLKTSDGKYVKNNTKMTLGGAKNRGFRFNREGVFGDLLAVAIRAEDNSSWIPDSGLAFDGSTIEYTTTSPAILTIHVHTAGDTLLGAICIGSFLATQGNCDDFCAANADECATRRNRFCSTVAGAKTSMCQGMYKTNGIADTNKHDSLFMKNAMIERCFDDLSKSGMSVSDFINKNSDCACFMADGFYVNMMHSIGENVAVPRFLFPACNDSTYGSNSIAGAKVDLSGSLVKVVGVSGTGEATTNTPAATPAPQPTPADGATDDGSGAGGTKLRNTELLVPIVIGVVVVIWIVIWLISRLLRAKRG